MCLVIDTNTLVSELLRKRGRDLIELSELEFYLAEKMKNEAQYELQKPISIIVSQTRLTEALGKKQLEAALRLIRPLAKVPSDPPLPPFERGGGKGGENDLCKRSVENKIITIPLSFYQSWEIEARKRISRDLNDWKTVALSFSDFKKKLVAWIF
jgi:hypothetical protein